LLEDKPQPALSTFDRLTSAAIPPSFLYPPYRLQRHLKPQAVNHYLVQLRKAIAASKVSSLIQARVQAQEGEIYAALSSYMKTDPAQWMRYDVECLKMISRHSGLQADVRRMIAAAIKAGRIPGAIAKELLSGISLKIAAPDLQAFKRRLKGELKQNGDAAKIALKSVITLLETRKFFLQREYHLILKKYETTPPTALPTETVTLLFLSAVKRDSLLEMYRWGQEIKRRYPSKETVNWVNQLTKETLAAQ